MVLFSPSFSIISMKSLYSIFSLAVLCACGLLVGIHPPKSLNKSEIEHEASVQNIPNPIVYLDTSFINILNSFDSSVAINRTIIKDLKQPLQLWYFDNSGELLSIIVNCYVTGTTKLNWNSYGYFNTFPPKNPANYELRISWKMLSECFNGIENLSLDKKYTVVIYYNQFWRKGSTNMAKYVIENLDKFNVKDSTNLVYVNNDTFFAYLDSGK